MTTLIPTRLPRALLGGTLLWLTGMAIGIVVFATPALRSARPIPFVSASPFITIPILVLWPMLAIRLARQHLRAAPNPAAEGLRMGLVFLVVNAVLDRALVVGVMGAGADFYSYGGLWLAYALLVLAPWLVGRLTPPASETDTPRSLY